MEGGIDVNLGDILKLAINGRLIAFIVRVCTKTFFSSGRPRSFHWVDENEMPFFSGGQNLSCSRKVTRINCIRATPLHDIHQNCVEVKEEPKSMENRFSVIVVAD